MAPDIRTRVSRLDWDAIAGSLDEQGYAKVGRFLTASECGELVSLYDEEGRFRSRVVMERLNFGRGEYKYFNRPLPRPVQSLRRHLYPPLAEIANTWAKRLGQRRRYPSKLDEFLDYCAKRGQTKPTPLMLCYGKGDYNCLHRDIYGEVAFPFQFVTVLSRRGKDFEGGELLLVEQRPRAQSIGTAIPLDRGEGVIFTTRERPVRGRRGDYRVNMRHGMSRLTRGRRVALGIIFHDAK